MARRCRGRVEKQGEPVQWNVQRRTEFGGKSLMAIAVYPSRSLVVLVCLLDVKGIKVGTA